MSREYSACLVGGIPLKMYRLVGVLWCGGGDIHGWIVDKINARDLG